MIRDVRKAFQRSSATLVSDAIGAASLVVMLVAGLHLPVFT